jgi:hypothetical protein
MFTRIRLHRLAALFIALMAALLAPGAADAEL